MGEAEKPEYYTDITDYRDGTQKVIDYWLNRWLKSRLNFNPIYQRIADFDKQTIMVGNQIKEDGKWKFEKLKEVSTMPVSDEKKAGLQFVRDFYRGMSAYADHVDTKMLSEIHLKTKLDNAVLEAVKAGKDVVLTGNPGDGKTHIIRVLREQLERLSIPVTIELDASTLSNEEIYQHWTKAHEENRAFVIAINAAVLYSVYNRYPKFNPIRNAYEQMADAVVFHQKDIDTTSLVVFDLSKRDALTPEILSQAILKMTDEEHYEECKMCPLKANCVAYKKTDSY